MTRPIALAIRMIRTTTMLAVLLSSAAVAQAPTPLGCFKDQGDPQSTNGRDLSGLMTSAPNMTGAQCVAQCQAKGFTYAGTQYGSYCFCGNEYGKSGPATNCNVPCAGNPGEICGGAWANSVYRTAAAPQAPAQAPTVGRLKPVTPRLQPLPPPPQTGSPEALRIRDYLDGLPRLPLIPAQAGTSNTATLPDGVTLRRTSGATLVNTQAELALLKSFPHVTWPGALVQGASIGDNNFAPIMGLGRAGGTIHVATNFISATNAPQAQDFQVMSPVAVDAAIRSILRALAPQDAVGTVSFAIESAGTLREALVKLGVAYSGAALSASLDARFNQRFDENTVVAKFTQLFYTVAFYPDPASASPFFAPTVTLADVQRFANPGNPPLFVSDVMYGRILLVRFTSTLNELDLEAAVAAAYNQFRGYGEFAYKEKLSNVRMDFLSVGTTGDAVVQTLQARTADDVAAALNSAIQSGIRYNPSTNPGAPIAFTMRYVGSRVDRGPDGVAIAQMVTQASPEVAVVGISEVCQGPFPVWDGPGGGWKDTGIDVYPGDNVRINATGWNWSGVVGSGDYGPRGWYTWDAPGDGGRGFPITDRSPFALIARFGGGDSYGVDATKPGYRSTGHEDDTSSSFFVGDSQQYEVGKELPPTGSGRGPRGYGRVWLGTNDSNPHNGDPNKKFSVTVCLKRSPNTAMMLAKQ